MVTVPLKNGSAKKAVNRLFVKNKRLKLKCSNGALKIRENQADPAEPSRLIFSKAVNFPNRDLKVEISFIAEKGIDVTIALGRPVSGGLYRFFDHGYHIDIKFHNHLFCQFSRRSSPLLRSEIEHITPGTTCAITIKRIGPVISIEMNGRIIMHYKDPRPIIGVFASHLYLYCWGHALELRKFAISIKTSKYNRETEEHDRSKFISFATVPGKLFNFYTEQIYCINRVAFVVGFNELPILSRNPGKDTLLSRLEEVRNHIESNYFRKTDFKKLAGMCCISYVHFINKFKEVYGSAPKSFQIECKLREAEKLLKSGKYQIKEVGEMIGFEDVVNFHHFIKKHRHTTPGYMREKPV
ncbi:MAG: hypothetical protein A2350_07545 [Candidatus Raymondbacteria bacterium RifOxyB12_full_50_8]|nr:MAG: hypothetical protein A2350_07545 [Candidatus Raymondbacteria bacterium RifOxyB12_full_50_8]